MAREIRLNTRATKLATLQATLAAAQIVFDAPARDRDLARIIRVGLAEPENLTDDEYAQLGWWFVLELRAGENVFVQYTAGALDRETWEARANSLSGLLASPAGHKIWRERAAGYRGDFQNWVASNLAERSSAAGTTPAG